MNVRCQAITYTNQLKTTLMIAEIVETGGSICFFRDKHILDQLLKTTVLTTNMIKKYNYVFFEKINSNIIFYF